MQGNRNLFAAIGATGAVLAALLLGFLSLGGPSVQRLVQADNKRVADLRAIAMEVSRKWTGSDRVLAATLDENLSSTYKDPVSGAPYEYRTLGASRYELCATFAQDNRESALRDFSGYWAHPQGRHCFQFDPASPVEPYSFR